MNLTIRISKENIWLKMATIFYIVVIICFEYDMSNFNKTITAIASMVLVLTAFMTVIKNRNFRKIENAFTYVMLQAIFLIYSLISTIWSFSITQSFSIFRLLVMIILSQFALVVLCSYYQNYKYVIIELILFVLVLIMIKTLMVTPVSAYGNVRRFIRYAGYNKNIFGMMYAMGSFLAIYMFDLRQKRKYLAYSLLLLIMALLAQSRKSVLMLLLFIPLYIILKSRKWEKVRNIVLIGCFIALFSYFVLYNNALYDIIGRRIVNLYISFTGSEAYTDGSITERAIMRKVAMQLTIQKPILGWGANYFASYFKSYSVMGRYAYCHCNYLELTVSYGIIGAVFFYLPYLYIIIKNIGGIKEHNKESIFNIVFFLVLFLMEYGLVSYYEPLFGLFKILSVLLLDNPKSAVIYANTDEHQRVIGA